MLVRTVIRVYGCSAPCVPLGRTVALDRSGLVREDDRLDPVAELELGQDAGDVGLDGRFRQVQPGGEFGVAQAVGEQAQHFELARGERGQIGMRAGRFELLGRGSESLDEAVGDRWGEEGAPVRTRRMAATRCSGVTSLSRKPLAPAARAS